MRRCAHPGCRETLTRHAGEPNSQFEARRYCGRACVYAHNAWRSQTRPHHGTLAFDPCLTVTTPFADWAVKDARAWASLRRAEPLEEVEE